MMLVLMSDPGFVSLKAHNIVKVNFFVEMSVYTFARCRAFCPVVLQRHYVLSGLSWIQVFLHKYYASDYMQK